MRLGEKTEVTAVTGSAVEEGRYLYCVADTGEKTSLGKISIDGNDVYTIPYQNICAVVHDCSVQPYQSDDAEAVKRWVMIHQQVVEAAWERWGTVLPLGFDTIIRGEGGKNADQNVKDWLRQDYERLKSKIDEVKGKAEYGVQVFWDPRVIAQNLITTNQELRKLNEEIKTKPKGLAYMYGQKLGNLVKREMETKADQHFTDFYRRLRKHADDIHIEKTKKAEPSLSMIMNLSCLVNRNTYSELGKELERINRMPGFSVRFTGPWPPYSFVGPS